MKQKKEIKENTSLTEFTEGNFESWDSIGDEDNKFNHRLKSLDTVLLTLKLFKDQRLVLASACRQRFRF